jgi:hypothetical protein
MALETEKPPRKKHESRFVKVNTETGVQGFQASMPTCGNDLIGLWDLPQEAVTQARLKIARTIPMSTKLELVRDCTVQEYSLESVARSFGKGEYQIILNPGPQGLWLAKSARITVSEEYARECGYTVFVAPPAAPRFSELRSIQETTQAMQQGQAMTPQVMVQLMETMIERVAERMKPAAPPDPMAGMGTMIQMMTFMNGIQSSAMETALKLAGLKNPTAPERDEEDSWPGVIREALPTLGELAKGFMARIPQPQPPAAPMPNPQTIEGDQPVSVPLSQDEMQSFAPMVALLKPHANVIVQLIKLKHSDDAAMEMASFIPEPMADQVVRFAELVSTRGAEVLNLIDPDLATEKGRECVIKIGELLREV